MVLAGAFDAALPSWLGPDLDARGFRARLLSSAPMALRSTPRTLCLLASMLALGGCDQIATQLGVGPSFVVVDDAHGIQIGNPVRLHGVTVGRVTEVGLVPEGARIAFELANREVLHADACGHVRREGLDGDAYVHLDTGRSEEPWQGSFTECESASMDEATIEAAGLLEDLRRYVGALERGDRTLCALETPTAAATPAVAPAPEAIAPPPPPPTTEPTEPAPTPAAPSE
jgi:hypothetical protein